MGHGRALSPLLPQSHRCVRCCSFGAHLSHSHPPAVWQRIHGAARNMTFLPSGNDFAEHVLDRLASGLRAKIATHVANNYYSHALLCKEAWSDAKKSAKASTGSSAIPADEILKHLLPHLSKRFPHTVGNSSRARSFLLSFFSSNPES